MKYLPKTYVFTDRDDFEISYTDIIERIFICFFVIFYKFLIIIYFLNIYCFL